MSKSATPEHVSYDEADARLGGALTSAFDGRYATVLLFDGDLTVDGNFPDAFRDLLVERAVEVVVVTGNLTVTGRIGFHDSLPGLYVGGRTEAETLEAGDAEVHIHDGTFTYLVHGYHNDGTLRTGTVETPWVIEHEHVMEVHAPGALRVDEYGTAAHADFSGFGVAAAFVPEVVDEHVELRIDEFLNRLRAGLPVLLPGAREAAEAARRHASGRADGVEHR
ncbi:hypothetical protein [Longispora urticae]